MDDSNTLKEGLRHQRAGNLPKAAAIYETILRKDPDNADALHLLGVVHLHQEKYDQAVTLIAKASSVRPDTSFFHNNLGLALMGMSRYADAVASFKQALALQCDYPEALINIARGYRALRRPDRALVPLQRVVERETGSAMVHALLGETLADLGRTKEAIACLERAVELDPESVETRHVLAGIYHDEGRLEDAISCYRKVIADRPSAASAYNNLASVLHDRGNTDQAMAFYRKALSLDPMLASAHNNIGNLFQKDGRVEAAIGSYCHAIQIEPGFAKAHNNLGMAQHEAGRTNEAVASFRRALELAPDYAEACAHLVHQLQRVCDWEALPDAERRLDAFTQEALAAGEPVAEQPFISLVRGAAPERQLAIAKSWSNRVARQALAAGTDFVHQRKTRQNNRLTIGYLSGNFGNHPMAHLMAGMFELHDRDRFRIHGYAFGPDDGSDYRRRIAAGCDRFVDIDGLDHLEAARRIYDERVDILVDLMGHTQGNRMAICALRPAPIQVRYLGLAGTSGADWFDYLVCDRTVVPPELAAHYSEAPLYMPHCYQVNDHRQPISERRWTRREAGLPETGPVLCCFNHSYKIDPSIFDVWMGILRKIPDAVLWLLATSDAARRNLQKRAAGCGVDPGRLVFAPKLPKPEHLARLRLADLGLDTRTVSGAATTSDALWAGVPVVTLAGDQFASRMSASILMAAGLPEFVTSRVEDFVAISVKLATNRQELLRIRNKLAESRSEIPLFDTHEFVRNLEDGLQVAWVQNQGGRAPEPIWVKERKRYHRLDHIDNVKKNTKGISSCKDESQNVHKNCGHSPFTKKNEIIVKPSEKDRNPLSKRARLVIICDQRMDWSARLTIASARLKSNFSGEIFLIGECPHPVFDKRMDVNYFDWHTIAADFFLESAWGTFRKPQLKPFIIRKFFKEPTIYLDADIFCCAPFDVMINSCTKWSCAITREKDEMLSKEHMKLWGLRNIPKKQMNSGVLVFREKAILDEWCSIFIEAQNDHKKYDYVMYQQPWSYDQIGLVIAAHRKNLMPEELNPIYNYEVAWKGWNGSKDAAIVHFTNWKVLNLSELFRLARNTPYESDMREVGLVVKDIEDSEPVQPAIIPTDYSIRSLKASKLVKKTEKSKRLLVGISQGIGNVIMATPMLRALCKMGWEVDIPAGVYNNGAEAVLQGLDVSIVENAAMHQRAPYTFALQGVWPVRGLERFSAMTLHAVPCHRIWAHNIFAHEVEANMSLAYAMGYSGTIPPLYCSRKESQVSGTLSSISEPLIGLHICNNYESQFYANRRLRNVEKIAEKIDKMGWRVVLIGGPGNKIKTTDYPANCMNCIGKLTIAEAADAISRLDVLVTEDSGITHVAAAMNCPQISIFGPTSVIKNRPWSDKAHVLIAAIECQPCQFNNKIHSCNDNKCMQIDPDLVVAHIERIFRAEKKQQKAATPRNCCEPVKNKTIQNA